MLHFGRVLSLAFHWFLPPSLLPSLPTHLVDAHGVEVPRSHDAEGLGEEGREGGRDGRMDGWLVR